MKITLGTYTRRTSQGIYTIELDPVHRKLHNLQLIIHVSTPTYLALDLNKIYSIAAETKGGVILYCDGRETDRHLDEELAPCYIRLHENGNELFTANYRGGHADVYSTEGSRMIHRQRFQYPTGSRAHCIGFVPMFNEVIVCDLGLDKIHAYVLENQEYVLKYTFEVPQGKGPRHFVVHPRLPILYVLTELSSEVLVLRHEGSGLVWIQTQSTLPEGEDMVKWASAIRISKDGKFLYTGQRGHDSISVFKIDDIGRVERIQTVSSFGKHPRDFNLSPENHFLVCANLDTDNLTLFARDEETGLLTMIEKDVFAPETVCVAFQEIP